MAKDQLNPNPMDIMDTMDIPMVTMVILISTMLLPTLLSKLLMVLLEFIPVVLLHPFPEVLKVWENKSFLSVKLLIKNNNKKTLFVFFTLKKYHFSLIVWILVSKS
jgi:hypothetical protein